jgi:peroxiredoxin Q/BCP
MLVRLLPFALLASLLAQDRQAAPPQVGQPAPDFFLPALAGGEIRLSLLAAKGPIVLVVLRGYPGYQCPICNRQVRDFLAHGAQFQKRGVQVVMIYPGAPGQLDERAREFTQGHEFPPHFRFLLDPDYRFTNLYGLRWDAPRETAYPSTFLLAPDLKVLFAQVSRGHGGRTTAQQILWELDAK